MGLGFREIRKLKIGMANTKKQQKRRAQQYYSSCTDDKLINNCRSLKCGNKTVIKARHQDPGGVTFSASTSGDVTYMQVINTTVVPHIG